MESYLYNRIDAVPQQRYLFRAAAFTSRGRHDKGTINAQSRQGVHDQDIFGVKETHLAREQIRKHLSWETYRAQVVLTSWSSSLIFVLIHAWMKQDRSSRNNKVRTHDIFIYVIDTHLGKKLNAQSEESHVMEREALRNRDRIHSAQKLISWFQPRLERLDLYDMEYLISGKLESTAENRIFSCVTLEDLIKSGLTTLLPELKQIEPSLHLATEYQSMVNGLFRSTSLLNPKEIQVVEKISSLFDDHFKDAMRVALVALRRRCMDTSQDATLSRFLSQLGEYEDRVAKCKPSVTDALYPSQAGGSGVLDSDQIMIFWRSICQHSGHTRQTQDPNRGLETIQVNPAPPDSDDAGRSWLYVKPIYEGPVITGLEKINMDKIIGKMESEGEDVDRQQAPPSSLSEARSGSVDQDLVVKETNTATEPSDTLPSQVHPSKDFWVFGEGSYRNAIAVIQKHFDQVEKDRNKAINEAYKKTGGLLPMFGPGPLGLLDQTATSDEFGGMYKSLKRKRD